MENKENVQARVEQAVDNFIAGYPPDRSRPLTVIELQHQVEEIYKQNINVLGDMQYKDFYEAFQEYITTRDEELKPETPTE